MKRWDAVVIGSGISSLVCAAILAKKGRSVCVYERHTKPGGYLHCFKRFGHRFDTGAHYVGALEPGDPFRTLLTYLGVYDPALFTELDPTGFDEFHFPSFTAYMAKGYERTVEGLAEQFPAEREGLRNYFTRVAQTARLFPTYHFRDEYDDIELARLLETSLGDAVRQEIRDPKLQCVLYAYCSLHGVKPDDVAFGLHSLVTDSLLRGAYGFVGGGDALADRFVAQIRANGGEVFTKCAVTKITVKSGEATEVMTDRGPVTADWVISGIHPKASFRLMSEATFKPAFVSRLKALPESGGIMGVYAVSKNAARFRAKRNYFFFDHENPRDLLAPRSADASPELAFVTRPERFDSEVAAGPILIHSPASVSWYDRWRDSTYGKRPHDYMALKEAQAYRLLNLVDRFENNFAGEVEKMSVSTPLSNLFFNGSEDGSAYGIYHSIAHTGARALGPRTHVKNFLLTGQSTLFPGLMGAATSGLRTAGSVLGIKALLRELMQGREA
jgi:all-trans-retinol 13,14-reductase